LAVVLGLVAVAVGLQFVLTALYSAAAEVWEVLDWFMAASVLLALAGYGRRWLGLSQADKSDLREYVGVNAGFYASVVLTMWFFPNWFNVLAGEEEMTMPWGFVDGLFVVVVGSVAANLWRASKTAA
jgi:hypothetical protein